jgi:hypothetical protein
MSMKTPVQRILKWCRAFVALCAVAGGMPSAGYGELVMKLSMSASPTGNMQFSSGTLAMLPDGQASTTGDRDMSIAYMIDVGQSFSSLAAIDDGSVTLGGMTASSPPVSNEALKFMVQAFSSGNIAVYGADDTLLLSGDLSTSGLQGALGTLNPQALFVGFGQVTGGSLAPFLDPNSLQLRIKYPQISGGFSISPPPNEQLGSFTTWTANVDLMAVVIPEPSLALSLSALAWMLLPARRRRRRESNSL